MSDGHPPSRLEAAIAQIWRDILKRDGVGVDDDFFALGGDSLQAVEMLAAVDEVLLAAVDFTVFVERPTVSGLASAIQGTREGLAASTPAATGSSRGPTPCTFAQERLWFLDQLTGATGAYNMPLGTRIRGDLDVPALEKAVGELARRHSSLRTTFAAVDGTPHLVVADEPQVVVERLDLREDPEPLTAAQQAVDSFVSLPFDLERGPLVRALLVCIGDEDHVLELVLDHTVCDGRSLAVIAEELGALYESVRRNEESPLAPPASQYEERARREREQLTDDAIERELAYWRAQLGGTPAALDLPADHARPARPSSRGGALRMRLPESLARGIRAFARAEGTTVFATLLTAFDVFLYRLTRQERIVVGSTSAARDHSERDGVGLYASTIVLRADLGGEPSFRGLLAQVRQTIAEAVAHQNLPFERLVAALVSERDPSRHPLFQVFFGHVPAIPPAIAGGERFFASPRTSRFDLTLWVEEQEGDGLDLVWEYTTDLFEPATIELFGRRYLRLLEAALAGPGSTVDELPLLDEPERRCLLEEWNDTGAEYALSTLHRLVEAQVDRTPHAVAVVFEESSLTYLELEERANLLAHRLGAMGVGRGSLVGVYLERSLELVVALLAVLKAGGAYVPLDPEYPAHRVAFMLEDANVPVLLTQERLLAGLPEHAAAVVCLDRDWPAVARESNERPGAGLDLDDAAYVIYTSGSTGQPKGAVNTHRGIVNRLLWMQEAYRLDGADRVLQKTPFSFDVSVWEFFWPLATGARLVVARPGGHRDPGYLVDVIEAERITTIHFVPSMLRPFVDFVTRGRCTTLKRVICSGEALTGDAVAAFFERFDCELHNLYGPTEAAIDVTAWQCRAEDGHTRVPIGRPIANTRIYILDPRHEPTPIGVAGEIYIGGVQVARGYLNRPELTAERFLANPFHPGSLYRTGDLARWTSDGAIDYLGRLDHQVKVRGFRIELGEIEATLAEHEHVAASAVVADTDAGGDTRLVAYVVLAEDAPAQGVEEELLAFLEDRLPPFMVPSWVTTLERLPLTPSGKLDRAALLEHARPAERRLEDRIPPETETEIRIADIWSSMLGIEAVSANDHFFRLGGHSLLAARVIAFVRGELGVEISVRALFDHPVLSAFAAEVDARRARGEAPARAAVRPRETPAPSAAAPLSFQQRQMLFLDDLSEGGATYNAALAFSAQGPLDHGALAAAIDLLIQRYEVLRTVLRVTDDEAEQIVLPERRIEIPTVETRDRGDDLRALLRQYARRPFDLSEDLLLRVTLFELAPDEHVVLFQTHHVAFDAWAVEVFLRELGAAYDAFHRGVHPALPALALQYRDFARWQRERMTPDWLEREQGFWRRYLAGAPTFLPLPTDRPRQDDQAPEADRHTIELPRTSVDRLRAACAAEDVTPYMFLLATFTTLLYRLTGRDDILVGGPAANRDRAEFEGVIGFFANTVVVRVDLRGNPTFRDLLARVRGRVLETLEHQELPFELVVESIAPERRPGVNPLVQVNFRTRVGRPPTLELLGAETRSITVEPGLARFDLALETHVHDEGLEADLIYATSLFERAHVERWARTFEQLLDAALDDPGRRLLMFDVAEEPAPAVTGTARIRGSRDGENGRRPAVALSSPGRRGGPAEEMRVITLPNGLRISHLNESETDFLYREIFVDRCYQDAANDLRDGDVVLDVGANIGLASLFFATVQPGIEVLAFEPAPLPFRALSENLRAHSVRSKLYQCGLHRHEGESTFYYYPDNTVMSGMYADPDRDAQTTEAFLRSSGFDEDDSRFIARRRFAVEPITCRLDTISNVLAREAIEEVALLKLDVEGAELDALAGIASVDWPRFRRVVVEAHGDACSREVSRLLRARGFDVDERQDPLLERTDISIVSASRA